MWSIAKYRMRRLLTTALLGCDFCAWPVAPVALAQDIGQVAPKHPGPAGRQPSEQLRPPALLVEARRALVAFRSAPFPYTGPDPATGQPFLDIQTEDRSGRLSPRTGLIHWNDEIYSDSRVLLDIPVGFNVYRPAVMIVFLHGNKATLERDVIVRQQVPAQVAAAGINSVLIAPQLAFDAWDSSAGGFWRPGALQRFLDEAATELARLHGDRRARRTLQKLPVVLIAYSGGYLPLAWLLHQGGATERIAGIILLDALYGEIEKFAGWIEKPGPGFFVSAFTASSAEGNSELARRLVAGHVKPASGLPHVLLPGSVVIAGVPTGVTHADFVTRAWVDNPLRDVLARIPGVPRQSKP